MKKKKYYIWAVLLIVTCMIPGCGKKEEDTGGSFTLGSSEEDPQPYWGSLSHNMAKGKEGYYFITYSDYVPGTGKDTIHRISYFDAKTKDWFVLCGKADCNHDDKTCNAYVDSLYDSIWYYQDHIYTLSEKNGQAILVQTKEDGSEQKELFEIGTADSIAALNMVFYEDCAYIYSRMGNIGYDTEGEITIRKRSLDGKTDKIVYSYTGTNAAIECAKGYGDKLFFVLENGIVDMVEYTTMTKGMGVYAFDYRTEETIKIIDKDVCDYTIDMENKLIYYYVVGDGLYREHMETKESVRIFEADDQTGICHVSFDGKYIYLNNQRWSNFLGMVSNIPIYTWVIDGNGTKINQIAHKSSIDQVYFGDSEFIFVDGLYDKGYIEKKNIETATEWEYIIGDEDQGPVITPR